MNQLWNHGCCSITQLVHALRDDTGWNKSTIHIMLSRMIWLWGSAATGAWFVIQNMIGAYHLRKKRI